MSAKITTSGAAWSEPVTLTEGEIWFIKSGSVAITLGDATPDLEDGIVMLAGDSIKLEAAEVVRHRAVSHGACTFAREPKS